MTSSGAEIRRDRVCRQSHKFTPTPTNILTHTNTQTWKIIQRTERFFRQSFSGVLRGSELETLIALTGGIPDGLLHCLPAAAHSRADKSPSAVHHRLRWKNWVKIPRCTSRCLLYSKKTAGMVLFRHTGCCYLPFYIPFFNIKLSFHWTCFIFKPPLATL